MHKCMGDSSGGAGPGQLVPGAHLKCVDVVEGFHPGRSRWPQGPRLSTELSRAGAATWE